MNNAKEIFSRTELLIGQDRLEKLKNSSVILFGVGGVGSFVAEALARGGVGKITLVDRDTVSVSNINRQLIALGSTVGRMKTEVMAERIKDINPEAEVECKNIFVSSENIDEFDFSQYDYVIDAIDTVSAKILLIEESKKCGTEVISSMGTGNKLHPEMLKIEDISKTSVCPLARVMRRELRSRGINHLKVLYSEEETVKQENPLFDKETKKQIPGSISFVPSCAGLLIASEVIRNLVEI